MTSISSIAASGMNAAQTRLNSSAHNIANLTTPDFRRDNVTQSEQTGSGAATSVNKTRVAEAALETDVVAQLSAKNSFLANLSVFKTSDAMAGSLLDVTA